MAYAMRTSPGKFGVLYEIINGTDGKIVWEKFVAFGKRPAYRAGGAAFVRAAHEQESRCAQLNTGEVVP